MALISPTAFINVVDRMGGQYKIINNAVAALNALGPASYFNMITGTDDADVEVPIISTADMADRNINTTGFITQGFASIFRLIPAIESHFTRVAFAGGFDQYCQTNNIRVSDLFHNLYLLTKGNAMLAKNVFATGAYVFSTLTINAGPVIGFVAGANFGNGAVPARQALNNNFAATQLAIRVVSMGAAQCNLTIFGTDPLNNLQNNNVVIPASSAPGTLIPIGTSVNRYLAVGSVAFTDVNQGTVGDQYVIVNIPERVI